MSIAQVLHNNMKKNSDKTDWAYENNENIKNNVVQWKYVKNMQYTIQSNSTKYWQTDIY